MQSNPIIPPGLCQCGCGRPTRIARVTYPQRGWVKGQPIRFINGHALRHHDSPEALAVKFWPRVDKRGPDECWPWLGTKNAKGYGQFRITKRSVGAHRIAYRLTHGDIAPDLFICHRCDNPSCCNPAHLFIGTPQDNSDDMMNKGRAHSPKGNSAPWSKLTEEQVREARSLYQKCHREFGYAGLARRYGVSATTMCEAITGVKWRHVQ